MFNEKIRAGRFVLSSLFRTLGFAEGTVARQYKRKNTLFSFVLSSLFRTFASRLLRKTEDCLTKKRS
jgi:hypothetical protein